MSANILWTVRVLREVEDTIEVSALTEEDAETEARSDTGVTRVLKATPQVIE